MFLDLLFVLSLLASASSQLRLNGVPIGPGEAGLALWICVAFRKQIFHMRPELTPALSRLVTFWIIFVGAMLLGWFVGLATGEAHDTGLTLHDVAAYSMVASFSCLSVIEFRDVARLRRVVWRVVSIGAIWFGLQLTLGLFHLGDDLWYWDRFRGWSQNTNQMALMMVPLALLSLHLAETADRISEKSMALACMGVFFIVGRYTKGDAFLLALLTSASAFSALKIRKWASERIVNWAPAAWLSLAIFPAILASAAPYVEYVHTSGPQFIKAMTRGGASGETEASSNLRMEIWTHGVRKAVESGMLGLGPGPHLEIPPSILSSRDSVTEDDLISHPEPGKAPNFEAHNTLIDLFLQGGVIVVLDFAWLIGATLMATYRARLDALSTLICAVAVYSIFHFTLRQPIVWFSIVVCIVNAFPDARSGAPPTSAGQRAFE